MSLEDRFSLLFDVGKSICSAYTGFSIDEINYCQQKTNWARLQNFLMSNDPYEAMIHLELNPIFDIIGYYQLFIGCMLQFPDEVENIRLKNLLEIIDQQNALDDALKNTKMLKALLAISAKYSSIHKDALFKLFFNCKRILAHTLRKFPDMFKLNLMRTKSKRKTLKFTQDDIIFFW